VYAKSYYTRTKYINIYYYYINIYYYYIKDYVKVEYVSLEYIYTYNIAANEFSKLFNYLSY
jgi:hypothetical protein